MSWPVGQHTLHGCTLRLRDRCLEKASLFPLFDGDGATQTLMVTSGSNGRIALVDYTPGMFTRRLLGPHELDLRTNDLRDAQLFDAERLNSLWHFDPWWELGNGRYADHPTVPALKTTNIPGFEQDWRSVWFDHTLGRASWVKSGKGDSVELRRFTSALLTRAEQRRERDVAHASATSAARTSWRLRPFWP